MDLSRKADDSPTDTRNDYRGDRKRLRSSQELDQKVIFERLNGISKNGFNPIKNGQFDVEINSKEGAYNCHGPSKRSIITCATLTAKMRLRSSSQSKNISTSSRPMPDTTRKVCTRSRVAACFPPSPQSDLKSKENGDVSRTAAEKLGTIKNGFFFQPSHEIELQKPVKSNAQSTTSESRLTSSNETDRQSCCAGEINRPSSLRLYNNHSKQYTCRWMDCTEDFQVSGDLAKHVKEKHVQPMIDSDVFFCLWNGCKVYNRPSCSRKWLMKHMYAHVGNRPFKCVIDGCELSFATQNGLARHVPSHFDAKQKRTSSNACVSPPVEQELSPSRKRQKSKWYMTRRNGAPLGNQEDGFDQLTMDYIKEKLLAFENSQTKKKCGRKNNIKPQVFARRTLLSGRQELLVDFKSPRSSEKHWISYNDFKRIQSLKMDVFCLPRTLQDELYMKYFSTINHRRRGRRK